MAARRSRLLTRGGIVAAAVAVGLLTGTVGLYGLAARQAWAQQVVADLSDHLIAITTGFTGTDVTLFGATDGVGDVVVVVRGPDSTRTVRRKDRVIGVWVNNASVTFHDVPSYYAFAASRAPADFLPDTVAARHQIGLDSLAVTLSDDNADETEATIEVFRRALIRRKQVEGLYATEPGRISFLGDRLFRYRLSFPSNVPTGDYTVTVFLVDRGEVVSAQSTPLQVSKVGVSAAIFRFAHTHPGPYGLVAIVVAVFGGWLAGVIFRK